jgi:hypothetical protein
MFGSRSNIPAGNCRTGTSAEKEISTASVEGAAASVVDSDHVL